MVRILVENGVYHGQNMGDLAMLQVTVSRLHDLWDNPAITALTDSPSTLAIHCPGVQPLGFINHDHVAWFPCLAEALQQKLPSRVLRQLYAKWEWWFFQWFPGWRYQILRRKLWKRMDYDRRHHDNQFVTLVETIQQADIVIASGGGYVTDVFPYCTRRTLSILNIATWLGKPTAMLGQGLGPLKTTDLKTLAQTVLPRVNLIALRESRSSPLLLKEVGVDAQRVMVTGDDAIEIVYNNHTSKIGHGIGINLRITDYSGLNSSILQTIRTILQQFSQTQAAPLLPIPISHADDPQTIQKLIDTDLSSGGRELDTPLKVITQAGRCRIVITTSYHGGVFSLAQGVPVIALVKSQYYVDKFQGLANQFGKGCEILGMDNSQFPHQLLAAMERFWHDAETFREGLLSAAQSQIVASRTAYKRLYDSIA